MKISVPNFFSDMVVALLMSYFNLNQKRCSKQNPLLFVIFKQCGTLENSQKNNNLHCVKSIPIWNYYGPYFTAFGLKMEIYEINVRIQSECSKIRTRKTNRDTFQAVFFKYTKAKDKTP